MLNSYKEDFAKILFESGIPMSQNLIFDTIESVPANIQGDLGFPCFRLSKELKKSPNMIATEFVEKINNSSVIAVGPYINYLISMDNFSKNLLLEINSKKGDFGKTESNGLEVVLEGWQPNTHKAFHIGHLRNALEMQEGMNIWPSQLIGIN